MMTDDDERDWAETRAVVSRCWPMEETRRELRAKRVYVRRQMAAVHDEARKRLSEHFANFSQCAEKVGYSGLYGLPPDY